MAFKKWHIWDKNLKKYVPIMVINPRQSFDPALEDEVKNPIDDLIETKDTSETKDVTEEVIEVKEIIIDEPEVVKEKLIDKNELFIKAKRAETLIEYIEAFWFTYDRILKQRLAEHFTMTIPNLYWLVWSKTFNEKLFVTLRNLDEKTVLDILLSFNIK